MNGHSQIANMKETTMTLESSDESSESESELEEGVRNGSAPLLPTEEETSAQQLTLVDDEENTLIMPPALPEGDEGKLLSGVPDFFDRNKILSGGDLSHYQVPHCIRVFFYFVWFVFIHHNFQFYFELCTYCNILDIYLS